MRRLIHKTGQERTQRTVRPPRIGPVVYGAVGAASAWLVVQWLATRFGWSPAVRGLIAFMAAWVALYPIARLNRAAPAWSHWARGAFVLVVLWIFTLFYR